MKKIISLVVPIIFAAIMRCMGQVTVSPEIGVSYLPFSVYSIQDWETHSNRIDYLIGMSGSLPISEKWYVNMRISYCGRERVKWKHSSIEQSFSHEYTHNDINIDFSTNFKITEMLHIGAGPMLIRKINSTLSAVGDIYGQSYTYSVNRFQYGVQFALSADFRFIILKLEYGRKIFKADNFLLYNITGKDRFNMTLAVPITKREKR